MSNKLLTNFSFYTIGNVLPKAASFLLLPIYTSYLDPSEYGIVGAMTAFSAFLAIFLTLNFERSIFRLLYDYKNKEAEKKFLGTVFIWIVIFASLIVLILFMSRNYVSKFYNTIDFFPYFLICILKVYFNLFGNVPKIYLQVKQNAKTYLLLGIIQFIITNCSILFFVVYLNMKADGYLLGGLVSSALMLPYFLWYTSKIVSLKFDKNIFKAISKFSLPILPAVISTQLIDLSDRVFIERFLTTTDLGIYSLSYSIASVVLIFTSAFKKAYDPYFYKIANTIIINEAKMILKKTNTLYYLITLLLCLAISIVSKEVLTLFFNENYADAHKVVPLICIAYAVSKISGLINLSFYQNKNTKLMMYISVVCAVINIALNFLLIPIYGYYGAAYATVITYLFMLLITYYFSKGEFFIEIEFQKLIKVSFIFISIYYIMNIINYSTVIMLLLKAIVLIFTSLFIFYSEKKNFKSIKPYA